MVPARTVPDAIGFASIGVAVGGAISSEVALLTANSDRPVTPDVEHALGELPRVGDARQTADLLGLGAAVRVEVGAAAGRSGKLRSVKVSVVWPSA